MTFAILRALHAIIGEALEEVEAIYSLHSPEGTAQNKTPSTEDIDSPECSPRSTARASANHVQPSRPGHRPTTSTNSLSNVYASPPPSPCIKSENTQEPQPHTSPDFPSLDAPYDPSSPSEVLTQHPAVVSAINRIIASCGQMTATIQTPFLTLCDATMGYHLPSCMRIFEASHTVEILREAGPAGSHVASISEKNGVNGVKLAHILRLLATHHIVREVSPDVFTLNRISSTIDTGKRFQDLQQWTAEGVPEKKYENTSGVAAFVGLCSDEIYKSSAYLTETYLLSPSKTTKMGSEPTRAPFCFAFGTVESRTGFFGWLEGPAEPNPASYVGPDEDSRIETGRGAMYAPVGNGMQNTRSPKSTLSGPLLARDNPNSNRFRLERFGKAMSGTCSWEAPGAILNSFDWHALPRNSVVVDVGGGIGSTSMLLASAFSSTDDALGLKFIIQDRPTVVEMGEKAWKAKCPEFIQNGSACFQIHDFFTLQPVKQAAVFLLRVVLHDWPDDFARRILLHLREAATSDTKLLLGDFILPLACPDIGGEDGLIEGIEGAESMLARPPLLPNLGKASANAYWMDLTMQVMFNAQERTLREIVILAASAGWKVTRVTKSTGSLFGYIVAVPTVIPAQTRHRSASAATYQDPAFTTYRPEQASELPVIAENYGPQRMDTRSERDLIERSLPRCGTPTFGSRMHLPTVEETLTRFGEVPIRSRRPGVTSIPLKPILLKQAITLTPVPAVKKKKPSPLSVPPPTSSVSPASPRSDVLSSPRLSSQTLGQKVVQRRVSLAHLRMSSVGGGIPPPLPNTRPPPSPTTPRRPELSRRLSFAHLSTGNNEQQRTTGASGLAYPSLIPVRHIPEPSSPITPRQGPSTGENITFPSPPPAVKYLRDSGGFEGQVQNQGLISNRQKYLQQPQQHRNVTRRSSLAQLRARSPTQKAASPVFSQAFGEVTLRKRTKSIVGLSRENQPSVTPVTTGNGKTREDGAKFGVATRIEGDEQWGDLLNGGNTSLQFEKARDVMMPGGFPEFLHDIGPDSGRSTSVGQPRGEREKDVHPKHGSVNRLAAAAGFEKRG